MNTRFYNARILKTNADHTFDVVCGELWVKGNSIAFIGDGASDEAKKLEIKFDKEIDCKNNLLMPGFKNAHTHTAMTFVRSHADDTSLQNWLFNQIFPREDKLTEDDIYWLDLLGIMEYLSSGITSNFDMYFFCPNNAKASIDAGFRTVQTSGLNNFGGSIDVVEYNYNTVNEMGAANDGLAKFIIGFHGEYTTSKELMEGIAGLADKYKSPCFTHNSETAQEVQECIERWGKTPTEMTDSLGMYKYGGGGYHCVHFTENDYEIFKKNNMTFVANWGSNLKLASGFPDVKKCLDKGINLALGTDGPASNNALDMFREMHLCATVPKVTNNDPACMPANEVLFAATAGGAKAMSLDDCDCLEVGKKADLVMIDMSQPNMQPENNIVKNIVYSGSKSNVALTMVNGKVLYEAGKGLDGYNINFDPKEIYAKANSIIKRINAEVGA